jgi:hypothetical protein
MDQYTFVTTTTKLSYLTHPADKRYAYSDYIIKRTQGDDSPQNVLTSQKTEKFL